MTADRRSTRRRFLKTSAAAVASTLTVPYIFTADAEENALPKMKNDRLHVGAIGMRYQGTVVAEKARLYGDVVAVCDVDDEIAAKAKQDFGGNVDVYREYEKMLQRKDIDIITIGTPDHWHTKMVVDACRAGKDVYCEKPLTLTIDEGKIMRRVVQETGRIVQVGSWQRSDSRFRQAVELVKAGRIGKLESVEIILGKNVTGGPFPVVEVPACLDWDRWQGQTPDVPYIKERCHYTFRWWYEYSGGQMTDWGAHHIDIGQWGAGHQNDGPVEIEGKANYPNVENGYNVAVDYEVTYRYADGVVMTVKDNGRNGVMFNGTEGRIFVNRGTVSGAAVEQLAENPLPRESYSVYDFDNLDRPPRAGKLDAIINHMGNFFDCVQQRKVPISNVACQHRSVTACHLGNISMKLGRKLQWDPEAELFVGDDEANALLKREQREPYRIEG